MLVEIRAGCGGQDSKNFVSELASVYIRYANNLGLNSEILHTADGAATIQFTGSKVWQAFQNESGKHVVQRCPPSEKGSRRHTSVVTVGILPLLSIKAVDIKEADIEIITQRGSGSGGQNQNKVSSAVRMKHLPTNISVFINGRDQHQNKKKAYEILTGRVQDYYYNLQNEAYASKRKSALGDSGRGGSRRTYNFDKSIIIDHVTGSQTNDVKSVMKGRLDLLMK